MLSYNPTKIRFPILTFVYRITYMFTVPMKIREIEKGLTRTTGIEVFANEKRYTVAYNCATTG